MRLNTDNYQRILNEKQLSHEYVQKAAGLSEKTYSWILDNGFIECETLERIADAINCPVCDILSPDYKGYSENVIEWIKDEKRATLTLSQRRAISRVKKLATQYPEQCQVVVENKDGSICAHIPVGWVKISPPKKVSDKQREISRSIILALNSKRAITVNN